jgi:hypothetical protein
LERRERMKILAMRIDALLAEARQMHVSIENLLKLIRRRQKRMISHANRK